MDDLTEISGIGPVYAKRLHKAGIRTFEQLIELTPERIHQIIKPRVMNPEDIAFWIDEARELADE